MTHTSQKYAVSLNPNEISDEKKSPLSPGFLFIIITINLLINLT